MEATKNLKEIFTEFQEKEFIFVMPGGNWGDHLIYFGAEFLAKNLDISYCSMTKEEFLMLGEITNKVIYIHGGGAFNEWCSESGFQLLTRALEKNNNIVIYGPASCGENEGFLNNKFEVCFKKNNSAKCIMFARENYTFSAFSKISVISKNATIYKDIDTAFHLTKEAIEERVGAEHSKYDFYAFREDNEACTISHEMSYSEVVFDPAIWCDNFEHWMKVHLYANKIVTNRTHSSVLGSILQKPTYLFEGSYHKNRSIWLEVLKDKGVKWIDSNDAITQVKPNILDKILPNVVKTSWKMKHAYWKWKKVP